MVGRHRGLSRMIARFGFGLLATCVIPLTLPAAEGKDAAAKVSHETSKTIVVKGDDSHNKLQTLCVSPDGHAIALVGLPRYGGPN